MQSRSVVNAALALLARWAPRTGTAATGTAEAASASAAGGGAPASQRRAVVVEAARVAPSTGGCRWSSASPSAAAATARAGAPTPRHRRAFASSAAPPVAAESADSSSSSSNSSPPPISIDPELLELLACPLTKQPLEVCHAENGDTFLLSRAAGARFPVGRGDGGGIPRLRPLQDGEVAAVGDSAAEDG